MPRCLSLTHPRRSRPCEFGTTTLVHLNVTLSQWTTRTCELETGAKKRERKNLFRYNKRRWAKDIGVGNRRLMEVERSASSIGEKRNTFTNSTAQQTDGERDTCSPGRHSLRINRPEIYSFNATFQKYLMHNKCQHLHFNFNSLNISCLFSKEEM